MEELIRGGFSFAHAAATLEVPITTAARVYYRMAREAYRDGLPIPGSPNDYCCNVRRSLEISMIEPPPGWFRRRTEIWYTSAHVTAHDIMALRVRFAAADVPAFSKIEDAMGAWKCKKFSSEVRYLADHAVLPPTVPLLHPRHQPAAWELGAVAEAEELADGSYPHPVTSAELDAILAGITTAGPPLLPLPAGGVPAQHIAFMLDIVTDSLNSINAGVSEEEMDRHRVRIKLAALFMASEL